MGAIMLVAFDYAPPNWLECAGQTLQISQYTALFSIIGTQFGGNGTTTFRLPDLRSRVPIHVDRANLIGQTGGTESVDLTMEQMAQHRHNFQATAAEATVSDPSGNLLATGASRGVAPYVPLGGNTKTDMAEHAIQDNGAGQAHDNRQPYLAMKYLICVNGIYPSMADAEAEAAPGAAPQAEESAEIDTFPYLAEIRIFPYNFTPKGWAACNGQILPIAQNQALFSLLGTTFGGDGTTSFALPELRGRVPLGAGQGAGLTNYPTGAKGGSETVRLTIAEIPSHDHQGELAMAAATTAGPQGNMLAGEASLFTDGEFNATLDPAAVGFTGAGAGHQNMMPFLTLQYCINLDGVFPSRPEA
jgi:microcystin-dependent protein